MRKFSVLLFSLTILSQLVFAGRYYDARTGRFLQIDPKAEKYPSLSPYTYVADNPLKNIDPDGKDIIVVHAPKGANNFGHTAVLIGNDKSGYRYYSKDGVEGGKLFGPSKFDNGRSFSTLKEFSETVNSEAGREGKPFTEAYQITASEDQDKKMINAAVESGKSDYAVVGASCITLTSDALKAGGFNPGYQLMVDPKTGMVYVGLSAIPNERVEQIKKKNDGKDVSSQLVQPVKKEEEKKKDEKENK